VLALPTLRNPALRGEGGAPAGRAAAGCDGAGLRARHRVANEDNMTLADALSADPRVSNRIDRGAIERLTSPKNYLGLAPQMVDRVLSSVER
jgi:adenylosuccinate lyase-like protein